MLKEAAHELFHEYVINKMAMMGPAREISFTPSGGSNNNTAVADPKPQPTKAREITFDTYDALKKKKKAEKTNKPAPYRFQSIRELMGGV